MAVLLHSLWLTALAGFLVVSTPVEPADVVVVLGGGGTHRVNQGIGLYQRGLSKSHKIVITGGDFSTDVFAEGSWAAMGAKYAAGKGIPPEDIIQANGTESTNDDVEAVLQIMKQQGYSSAIFVSDIFHMRRVKWIAEKNLVGYKVLLSPAESPALSIDRWWTRERELLYVMQEYVKLGMYLIRYGPF